MKGAGFPSLLTSHALTGLLGYRSLVTNSDHHPPFYVSVVSNVPLCSEARMSHGCDTQTLFHSSKASIGERGTLDSIGGKHPHLDDIPLKSDKSGHVRHDCVDSGLALHLSSPAMVLHPIASQNAAQESQGRDRKAPAAGTLPMPAIDEKNVLPGKTQPHLDLQGPKPCPSRIWWCHLPHFSQLIPNYTLTLPSGTLLRHPGLWS